MEKTLELSCLRGIAVGHHAGRSRTELLVACEGNSLEVLQKTTDVLIQVLEKSSDVDDSIVDWEAALPTWFVRKCAPEMQDSEVEKFLRTEEGTKTLSEIWTVSGFLYWFLPAMRSWYWSSGTIAGPDKLSIHLIVDGFPFAWGALKFLLRAAGAREIVENGSK